MSDLTVVILAAGLGTRMRSARAKVLHRAGGMTLVEHVVETALELTTPERVFVVVGHQAEEVKNILASYGVRFLLQSDQKGTGHAVMIGREALEPLGGYLLVLYGDCPMISTATLRRLESSQVNSDAAATVITTLLDDPTGYGRVIHNAERRVLAIVEQKAASEEQLSIKEINSGIYCFRSDLFWPHLAKIRPDNPVKEYYLTDIVGLLNQAGHAVRSMRIYEPDEVLGINNRLELAEMDRKYRDRKARQLMLEGVTIEKPETVTIDKPVTIGPDTIIGPFAQLLGRTVIGSGCRVGACSIVKDSVLEDGAEVGPFTMVSESYLEAGASAGPYARLRMGARVERRARVGNFVEMKNARLGAGAKAQHLAYLGDAEIGAGANIGAGTITCNYDGKKKHRTIIRDGAFIGSNATLVAPVEVGEGAYVAAGSVITAAVPAGALGLGRSRQLNKEGWTARKKSGG